MISSSLAYSVPAFHPAVQQQVYESTFAERGGHNRSRQPDATFSQALAFSSQPKDTNTKETSGKASAKDSSKDADAGATNADPQTFPAFATLPSPVVSWTALLGLPGLAPSDAANSKADGTAIEESTDAKHDLALEKQVSDASFDVSGATSALPLNVSKNPLPKGAATATASQVTENSPAWYVFPAPIISPQPAATTPDRETPFKADSGGTTPASANSNIAAQSQDAASEASSQAVMAGPVAFTMLVSRESGASDSANPPAASEASQTATAVAGPAHLSSIVSAEAAETAVNTSSDMSANRHNDLATPFSTAAEGLQIIEARPEFVEQSGGANAPNLESNLDTGHKEAVRNVRLQVTGDDNQRVDVRVFDQGGELRVSIRSTDASITQELRNHVPELTNRLEQNHFRSEIWIPRSSDSSGLNSPAGRGFPAQDGSQSDHGQSGRRQSRQQDNPAEWPEEQIPVRKSMKEISNQICQQ